MTFTPSLGRRREENDRRSFPPVVSPVRYAWERTARCTAPVVGAHAVVGWKTTAGLFHQSCRLFVTRGKGFAVFHPTFGLVKTSAAGPADARPRRKESGWWRSAPLGTGGSRGTCARRRIRWRSRSRHGSAGRRWPPPSWPWPPGTWPYWRRHRRYAR